jgi:hypothetical protein
VQARRPARGRPSACPILLAVFAVLEARTACRRSARSRSAGVVRAQVAAAVFDHDRRCRYETVGGRRATSYMGIPAARQAGSARAWRQRSRRSCATTELLHGRGAGGRCFYAGVAARASEAFPRSRPRFRKPNRLRCRWSQQRRRGLAWRSGFWANLTTPEVAVGG